MNGVSIPHPLRWEVWWQMRDSEMKITVHHSAMAFKGRTSSLRWVHGLYKDHRQLVLTKWLILVVRCDEKCQVPGWECFPTHFPSCWLSRLEADIWNSGKITNRGQSCLLSLGPLTSGMLVKEKNLSLDLRWINTGNRNHSSEKNGIEYIKSEEERGPWLTSKNYSQNVTKMIVLGKHCCRYQVQYTATLLQRTADRQKANASRSLTYSTHSLGKILTYPPEDLRAEMLHQLKGEYSSSTLWVCDCSRDYLLTNKNLFSN